MARAALTVRPAVVLFDIGMTLIYPSGNVMVREITRLSPATAVAPVDAARALAIAAEAHAFQWDLSQSDTDIVGSLWGNLLKLPTGVGPAAWARCVQSADLYTILDPDAEAVLRSLRKMGIKTAAVSNSSIPHRDELAEHGLLSLFDTTVGSEEGHPSKPAAAMFAIALDQLGVSASRAWHVGDGLINDVLGSCLAGIRQQVLVDRYAIHRAPPCVTVRSMLELGALLKGL